jgi:protein TonB
MKPVPNPGEALAPPAAAALLLGPEGTDRRFRPLLAWGLRLAVVVLVMAGLLWLRERLRGDETQPLDRAQRIALLSSPRPPPKPPEPPPEPQRELVTGAEVRTPLTPAPAAEAPAVGAALGVDSDGQGAGDGFGLVGKRGGRDITTLAGPGGAGTGATDAQRFAQYAGLLLQKLRREISLDPRLREHSYVAVVHLWVDPRGRVVRSEIDPGSGRLATDAALREAFGRLLAMPEPPGDLPQPIRLRITSRDLVADGR